MANKDKEERERSLRHAAKLQRQLAKQKKKTAKIVKKKWVPMYAPPFFGEQVLGECFTGEQDSVMNRKITVSLMNLTREAKKQSASVTFQAVQLKGHGVITAMIGYELGLSAARRLVRKGKDKISDSFLVTTKDQKTARIKPFFVAKGKVPNSLHTSLRMMSRSVLTDEAKRTSYQKLVEDTITGKIQKMLRINLQKIYPLSAVEIRKLSIESSATPLELGEAPVKEEPAQVDQVTEAKVEAKAEVVDQVAEVEAAKAKPKRAKKPKVEEKKEEKAE